MLFIDLISQDTSEILLIDDVGCPTDYSIMAELEKFKGGSSSSHSIRANFDAFKFPTSNVVQFRALVCYHHPSSEMKCSNEYE